MTPHRDRAVIAPSPGDSTVASVEARVGDLRFRVRISGPTGAPPVAFVLVHGIGMSHRSQHRLHDRLAVSHRVASLDLPGFGRLPKPKRDITVTEMSDAAAEVLEAVDLSGSILVGHSMGTQWVTEIAARHHVAGVALIGPVVDDRHRRLRDQGVALLRDSVRESPAVNAQVVLDYARCGPRWFLAQMRHMLRYPIVERVAGLTVPVLVIRGTLDPIAGRSWCERLAATASAGTLTQIPGAPHHAQWRDPAAVARALLAFADTLPGRRL